MGALHPGEIAIGALARELGLTTATIHFYVKEGLVPPPRRINRTRAAYDDRHRRLLRLVKRLRANRLSIQQMRNMFALFGTDERGLANMEGIARYQPVPSARGAPPVEPFDPVDRATFLARADLLDETLARLEALGLVRPIAGAYDHYDLSAVRFVAQLFADGAEWAHLERIAAGMDAYRAVAELWADLTRRNIEAVRAREVRQTELVASANLLGRYLVERLRDEAWPGMDDLLYLPPAR